MIRSFLRKEILDSFITQILIYRKFQGVIVIVYTLTLPSLLKKGLLNNLTSELSKILTKQFSLNLLKLDFIQVINPYSLSSCIAYFVKRQLERRVPFRKAITDTIIQIKEKNTCFKGLKIQISGRLNGAEIARTEWIKEGQVPLHTLVANIDYSFLEAIEF